MEEVCTASNIWHICLKGLTQTKKRIQWKLFLCLPWVWSLLCLFSPSVCLPQMQQPSSCLFQPAPFFMLLRKRHGDKRFSFSLQQGFKGICYPRVKYTLVQLWEQVWLLQWALTKSCSVTLTVHSWIEVADGRIPVSLSLKQIKTTHCHRHGVRHSPQALAWHSCSWALLGQPGKHRGSSAEEQRRGKCRRFTKKPRKKIKQRRALLPLWASQHTLSQEHLLALVLSLGLEGPSLPYKRFWSGVQPGNVLYLIISQQTPLSEKLGVSLTPTSELF